MEQYWKSIKTFEDAYEYCLSKRNKFIKYIDSYNHTGLDTYEDSVAKLRMVIAALTNNEKISLTKRKLYCPVIQFCTKK